MERSILGRSWSPYAVGAGIGLLSWYAFATVDRGLGITSAFEHVAASVLRPILGDAWSGYFAEARPRIGWEVALVVGVALGALVASFLGQDRQHPAVPLRFRLQFGDEPRLRAVVAFFGGAIMMIGARLAQGCTTGHGMTGVMQLAVSSLVFVGLAFPTAIVTARTMYGGRRV